MNGTNGVQQIVSPCSFYNVAARPRRKCALNVGISFE
jgi:hypothetical protein